MTTEVVANVTAVVVSLQTIILILFFGELLREVKAIRRLLEAKLK